MFLAQAIYVLSSLQLRTRLILRTPSHLDSVLFGAKYFHITIPSFKSVTGWQSCLSDFSFASFTKSL